MARTTLVVQSSGRLTQLDNPTLNAAHADGNKFDNSSERVVLYITNGNAATLTVTMIRPGTDVEGLAIPDKTYSILTTATAVIGPFPRTYNQDGTTNEVWVDWSVTTSVTVQCIKVPLVGENI